MRNLGELWRAWPTGLRSTVIDNPQRFVKDYLNVKLKLFQKILLYAMMHNYYILYLAARGRLAVPISNSWVIKWAKSVEAK